MNRTENHIGSWSATDVQKYLRGELPPAEMHHLEKLALDDPFLADALEGLQAHAPADPHLAELRTRLQTRITRKKAHLLPVFKIAAAVILLLGLGFTAWYTLVNNKNHIAKTITPAAPIATGEPKKAADSSATFADSSRITTPALAATNPAATNPAVENRAAAKTAVAKTAAAKPTASASHTDTVLQADALASAFAKKAGQAPPSDAEVLKKSNNVSFDSIMPPSIAANDVFKASTVLRNRSVTIGSKDYRQSPNNLLAFSGRVLDLNNHPVAGANLYFNNTANANKLGTVTDRQGKFSLYLPQEDTTRILTVASIGYQDAQYALNTEDRNGNTIYLKESPSRLDEVVITGYGSKRRETMAAPPSDEPEVLDSLWLKTVPAIGRIAYIDYLLKAKKTLAVDSTIHGTETISFQVDRKGNLTEFKIERSLSPAHDAGLIRLVTDGPPWKMTHGKKARAEVNLSFP